MRAEELEGCWNQKFRG